MIIKKNMFFLPDKPKVLLIYLLSLALFLWGIGNVFYWEIYKRYSACTICPWHRVIYIALFISLLMLFKYRKLFIKFLVWIALILETSVSLVQIFEPCSPLVCGYISLTDKLNLSFIVSTLVLTLILELRAYLKHKKYLNLRIKYVDNFPNFKIN